MFAMGLTGKVAPYKIGFGPMPGEIFHLPFPAEYLGVTPATSLAALDTLFKADVDPARVAAIIIEPVQGEGGFYPAPVEFLRELRRICTEHGIVMIADEVQTGFARTGKMFAIEHAGVEPDLMTVAKSLAGGFPLSGVIGKAEIMDAPAPGGLGGTYAGSPLSCAAALAVLDVIEKENLCARANTIGAQIKQRLNGLRGRHGLHCVGDVRGLGAMIALELVKFGDVNAPDADLTKALVQRAAANGLDPVVRHARQRDPLPRAADRQRRDPHRRPRHLRALARRGRGPGRRGEARLIPAAAPAQGAGAPSSRGRARSVARHRAAPARQIVGILALRESQPLLQRGREVVLDPPVLDAAAQEIGPQEFAEWRRVLGIAPGVAQFAGQAAERVVHQLADAARQVAIVPAPAPVVVRVHPAAVVEVRPERLLVELAEVGDDRDRDLLDAFVVQRAGEVMVVDEVMPLLRAVDHRDQVAAEEPPCVRRPASACASRGPRACRP